MRAKRGGVPMGSGKLRRSIGVLDFGIHHRPRPAPVALRNTCRLARVAEEAGFDRFWVTEHHTEHAAQSTPEILATAIAATTRRIRVGTGGVLLPYYSPFKVAENFLAMHALFPGRIDLGFGRGPGATPEAIEALAGKAGFDPQAYEANARELVSLLRGAPRSGRAVPTPRGVAAPPIWLLGASARAASFAAELGVGFVFGRFIVGKDKPSGILEAALAAYKERAPPVSEGAMVALSVRVEEEASFAESALPDPDLTGPAEACAARIVDLVDKHGLAGVLVGTVGRQEPAEQEAGLRGLGAALADLT